MANLLTLLLVPLLLPQLQSELNAADLFAGNPLMATSQAACFDSEGNFCTIMPYAGCSLGSLLEHPDWFEKTSVQERLDFSKTVMLHNLMAYKSMQKAVSATFKI